MDEFVYTPKHKRSIILSAAKCALLFIGKTLENTTNQNLVVKTPVATLGIRGTHFWVGPIDGAIGVLVLEGKVYVDSQYGLVSLGPGEGTMIKSNGSLTAAKRWGEAKKIRALEMTQFQY